MAGRAVLWVASKHAKGYLQFSRESEPPPPPVRLAGQTKKEPQKGRWRGGTTRLSRVCHFAARRAATGSPGKIANPTHGEATVGEAGFRRGSDCIPTGIGVLPPLVDRAARCCACVKGTSYASSSPFSTCSGSTCREPPQVLMRYCNSDSTAPQHESDRQGTGQGVLRLTLCGEMDLTEDGPSVTSTSRLWVTLLRMWLVPRSDRSS